MPKVDLRTIEKRLAKLECGHKQPTQRIRVQFFGTNDTEKHEIMILVGCVTTSNPSKEVSANAL